jgi:hypothetical protein
VPSLLRAAAIQLTAPDAVATVAGEPKLAPLSLLSRTWMVTPLVCTENRSTLLPWLASASPAEADTAATAVQDEKSPPGPGLTTRW